MKTALIAWVWLATVGVWLYLISDKPKQPCNIECKRQQVIEKLSQNTSTISANKILVSNAEQELKKQKQFEKELSGKQAKIVDAVNKFDGLNKVIEKANEFNVNDL